MRYYSDPTLTINQANNMTPDVTWTFQTADSGSIVYSDSDKWFVKVQDPNHMLGNQKVFKDQSGRPSIPIGTLVIKEVKAPNGWQLNNEEKVIHYTWDSALNTVIADVDEFWNTDNKLNDLSLDSKEVPSEPDVGSLQIAKWDKDLGDGYTKQGGGRIGGNGTVGTKFALINRTGGSIEYTKNGRLQKCETHSRLARVRNSFKCFHLFKKTSARIKISLSF